MFKASIAAIISNLILGFGTYCHPSQPCGCATQCGCAPVGLVLVPCGLSPRDTIHDWTFLHHPFSGNTPTPFFPTVLLLICTPGTICTPPMWKCPRGESFFKWINLPFSATASFIPTPAFCSASPRQSSTPQLSPCGGRPGGGRWKLFLLRHPQPFVQDFFGATAPNFFALSGGFFGANHESHSVLCY